MRVLPPLCCENEDAKTIDGSIRSVQKSTLKYRPFVPPCRSESLVKPHREEVPGLHVFPVRARDFFVHIQKTVRLFGDSAWTGLKTTQD